MSAYWWGVLSPFILIAALGLLFGLVYLLATAGHWLWMQAHEKMIQRVKLRINAVSNPYEDADERPDYEDSANKFRDALLDSPRLYSVAGLGWRIMLVREYKEKSE